MGDKQLFPDVCENIYQGIVTDAAPIFLTESVVPHPEDTEDDSLALFFSEALDRAIPLERDLLVPVVRREGFTPFWTTATHTLLLTYDKATGRLFPRDVLRREYPRAWAYIAQFENRLRPRRGDYVVESNGFRLSVGIVEGAHVGDFAEDEDAEDAIREHRASTSPEFFPEVWHVSDHGNVSRYAEDGFPWEAPAPELDREAVEASAARTAFELVWIDARARPRPLPRVGA